MREVVVEARWPGGAAQRKRLGTRAREVAQWGKGEIGGDEKHVVEVFDPAVLVLAVVASVGVQLLGELLRGADRGDDDGGEAGEVEQVVQGELLDGSGIAGDEVEVEVEWLEQPPGEAGLDRETDHPFGSFTAHAGGRGEEKLEVVAEVETHCGGQDGLELVRVGPPGRVGVGSGAGKPAAAGDHGLAALERPAVARCNRGYPGEEALKSGFLADAIQR